MNITVEIQTQGETRRDYWDWSCEVWSSLRCRFKSSPFPSDDLLPLLKNDTWGTWFPRS